MTQQFLATVIDDSVISAMIAGDSVPVICQERLVEPEEYRSYFFGDRCVTLAIQRTGLPAQRTDIHFDSSVLDTAAITSIPGKVVNELRDIKALTGLNVLSIDYFIVNGSLRVLEINPLTSWAWLPPLARLPVVAAIRDYLHSELPSDY